MIYTVTLNTAIDRIVQIDGTLTRKKNNKIKDVTLDIGGKATHVSVVLSKLDIPNVATGFVGSNNGEKLIELMELKDVHCEFIAQEGCSTREAIVILDDSGEGSYMITEPGFELTVQSREKLMEKLAGEVLRNDIVVFAGSPPRGLDVNTYLEILESATVNGGKLVIDASGDYLKAAISLKPYMIKPNEYEFQELVGRQLNSLQEFEMEMRKMLDSGIEYVIISLGKNGSLIGHGEKIYQVTPPKIKEVNDTGCGDVFVGGVVAGLYRNDSLEDMIRFATALSASKATQNGSSAFCLEQTKELEEFVKIVELGQVMPA